MKPTYLIATFCCALALPGCQIVGGAGEVSGSLTDINGAPVRGASIYFDGQPAGLSSPNGTFTIREAASGVHTVEARLTIGATTLRGRNQVVVFEGERTTSVGLVIAPVSQLATMRGRVRDFNGVGLDGARVFAGGPLNSWMAVCDSNGNYQIDDLVGGFSYTVTGNGRGYENDTQTLNAVAGTTHTVNFTLFFSSNQQQNGIANLTATAWTSPVDPDRRASSGAYERIKQLVDPKRTAHGKSIAPKASGAGHHIEIDLSWDYQSYTELLGYGIYRGNNAVGALQPLDVLRDPLASFYADISEFLIPGIRTYYQVTRLNNDAPQSGSESPLSADTSGVPLGDLTLVDPILSTNPTFRWSPVASATQYVVFVFSYYPDYQAVPVWTSPTTSSTSTTYAGPALVSGNRYYYVVVGSGFSDASHTISPIDSFLAP